MVCLRSARKIEYKECKRPSTYVYVGHVCQLVRVASVPKSRRYVQRRRYGLVVVDVVIGVDRAGGQRQFVLESGGELVRSLGARGRRVRHDGRVPDFCQRRPSRQVWMGWPLRSWSGGKLSLKNSGSGSGAAPESEVELTRVGRVKCYGLTNFHLGSGNVCLWDKTECLKPTERVNHSLHILFTAITQDSLASRLVTAQSPRPCHNRA